MTDKGQIIFTLKVKWYLKSHSADTVENYRGGIFVGHFILFSSTVELERGEKKSVPAPCLWLFAYPVTISGFYYRSAIFSVIILTPEFCGIWKFVHSENSNVVLLWCRSDDGKSNPHPLLWALKYFSALIGEISYREMCIQILCSPSPWPFSWDCQQMIAEHLPGSSNFQSSVYNNAKSVFCCQPLVYNNAKSVFCCWECLIHYGPCPNHLNVNLWWCTSANLPEIAS